MSDPQTRINEFRAAVVNVIKAGLPALLSCEAQFAAFDLDDLKRRSVRTPAVRFAVVSAGLTRVADGFEAPLKCAAFIIHDGKDRDDKAWAIAEALALQLDPKQLWGINRMTAPANIQIKPLTSPEIERRGVSLIAVQWDQTLTRLDAADLFASPEWLIEGLYVGDELVEPEAADV